MNRTRARETAVQLIFASAGSGLAPEEQIERYFSDEHYSLIEAEDGLCMQRPDEVQMEYIRKLTGLVWENRSEIDGYIERYARGWRVERISKTALAVLRCALCEIIYMDDVPDSAAINEAVELSKSYDEPDTVAFINGVLGGFMRGERGCEADGGAAEER